MGCVKSRSKEVVIPSFRIVSIDDIQIGASTFISSNGKSFQEVYSMGPALSNNAFSETRKAINRDSKEERAVKIFRKDIPNPYSSSKIQSEISIMKDIDYPNIIRIYEIFDEPKRLYIVMELCNGGELFDQILQRDSFSESQVAHIMKELLSTLAYIHKKRIIHRDIKPENILLEESGDLLNIKLINFSSAVSLQQSASTTGLTGSAYYIAPEMIQGAYNEKVDLWSSGVVMYMLLSHYPPFEGNSDKQILECIISTSVSFQEDVWTSVSQDAKDFISKLLCPAETRLSALDALSHPWITLHGSTQVTSSELIITTFQNLRSFHNSNKLRDAVQTYIATQCVSSYDTKELKEIFKSIDSNGDGMLSKEELLQHYVKVMGQENAEEEVNGIMKEVDTDSSGFINYTEFLKAAMSQRLLLSSQNLRKAFDLFDKDNSGTISAAELKKVLEGGLGSDDSVWLQIVNNFDQNSDGEIDLMEFEEIITGMN